MDLQTDAEGNFYYAKAARHGKTARRPAARDAPAGQPATARRTEILATGFRAPNGVCLNPDGTFFLDRSGGLLDARRTGSTTSSRGGFYGNMWGYHDVTDPSDSAMEPPVCWITNAFDRSPAELRPGRARTAWGPLKGSLLNLSYGYGQGLRRPARDRRRHDAGGHAAPCRSARSRPA